MYLLASNRKLKWFKQLIWGIIILHKKEFGGRITLELAYSVFQSHHQRPGLLPSFCSDLWSVAFVPVFSSVGHKMAAIAPKSHPHTTMSKDQKRKFVFLYHFWTTGDTSKGAQ